MIPPDTKLTPRPTEIPAWDSLSPDRKRVASRLMEAFAAYTAQTDYEVGRVLDALDETGITKDTLVLWEIGDNGPPSKARSTAHSMSSPHWPESLKTPPT